MLFTTSTIALVAALLPATLAAPMQKRMTGATIEWNFTGNCLSLPLNGQVGDGTLLVTTPCRFASKWDINYGSGSVLVSGTNFALDAGVPQGNNAPAKVWTSYPGSTQQTWYLTEDNRIAVTGGNQCLDQGPNGPQTYQCTPGNTNQVWRVSNGNGSGPSSTTSSPVTTSTSTASATSSSAYVSGTPIRWRRDFGKCLTVSSPLADGASVSLQQCDTTPNTDLTARQTFQSTSTGGIRVGGTNYCLDGQASPYNGGQLQIWTCYGSPQQTFKNAGYGLIQTSNNQCLDVDNSDYQRMQTWECSSTDRNQMFSFF